MRIPVLVVDEDPPALGRSGAEAEHLAPGTRQAHPGGLDPHVGGGQRLHRLVLGALDSLEGRVAGLVGAPVDAHHRRQGTLDHVVALVGFTMHPDTITHDFHLFGLAKAGQVEVLGEGRRHEGGPGVGRLGSTEDQVVAAPRGAPQGAG